MLKGGYQIIDLKGVEIEAGGTVVGGVYKLIDATDGKAFLVSGINYGGGVVKDRFVAFDKGDTSYFGALDGGHMMYIDGDDTVEIVTESSVPPASTRAAGVVKVGTNIAVTDDGTISISAGSKGTRGIVKVGDNIDVDGGVISVPIASASTAGVIKVGSDFTISADGTLSLA